MAYYPVISGPVAPYSNLPITPQFYQPSQFEITGITFGITTTVTMANGTNNVSPNYVIGQEVRLVIPPKYGARKLNGKRGFVISLPSSTQVEININSVGSDPFIANPFIAGIEGASNTNPVVLNVNNSFKAPYSILIADVGGMTELNGNTYEILGNTAHTMTIGVDGTNFGVYTSGGGATLTTVLGTVPQILAIGDISTGQLNANGRINLGLTIPGAFENISP